MLLWNLWQTLHWQRAEQAGVTLPCFGEIKPCQFSRMWVYSHSVSSFQLSVLKKPLYILANTNLKLYQMCPWVIFNLKMKNDYTEAWTYLWLEKNVPSPEVLTPYFFFGMKNLLYFYLHCMSYFSKLHNEELVIFISKVYNQAAP